MKYFIFRERGSEAYIPVGLVTFAMPTYDLPIFAIKCESIFYKTRIFEPLDFQIFKKSILKFILDEDSCNTWELDFDEGGWSDVTED